MPTYLSAVPCVYKSAPCLRSPTYLSCHVCIGVPPAYATLAKQCWDDDPPQRPTFPTVLLRLSEMLSTFQSANSAAASAAPGANSGAGGGGGGTAVDAVRNGAADPTK
jgi:hypothetical protein